MKKILLVIMIFLFGINNCIAKEDLTPNAKSSILVDSLTGKILYEKNADMKLAPASMTKLASMLIIMEYIDSGKLSFEDNVLISEEASKMGGSQVYLETGETYKVKDLLKGIVYNNF